MSNNNCRYCNRFRTRNGVFQCQTVIIYIRIVCNIAKVSNIKMKLAIYVKLFNISEAKKSKKRKKKNIHSFIHSKIKQCLVCLHGTLYNANVHYAHSVIYDKGQIWRAQKESKKERTDTKGIAFRGWIITSRLIKTKRLTWKRTNIGDTIHEHCTMLTHTHKKKRKEKQRGEKKSIFTMAQTLFPEQNTVPFSMSLKNSIIVSSI